MSTTHDDGGPAYPVAYEHSEATCEQHGMSLRDYFAAKAMQAFISRADIAQSMQSLANYEYDSAIARWSYETADAMLKARGAKP